MKPTHLTRHTFNLGGRTLKYGALSRYVCNECGGGVTHRAAWDETADKSVDQIACAQCGGDDLISESRYLEQISDGYEVEQHLPAPLKALLRRETGTCRSATEAIADLFD